jgi:hypothetical protein
VKLLTCAATTRTWGHGSAIVPQSIRKQATDLRYIFEAPKLKIGDDERVSIPDLSDADALAYALTHKKTLTPLTRSLLQCRGRFALSSHEQF